jgi:predicted P-loop ATPase/GTPase
MTGQLQLLNERKKASEEKNLALSRTKKCVEKAESLHLTRESWAVDKINLDQTITFLELEQLLNQCTNSTDYYFKPSLLKITVPEKPREDTSTLNLKLRGTFLTSLN